MSGANKGPTDPKDRVFTITVEACLKGGERGGEYLDSIGATFPALTLEQWTIFCNRVVGGAFVHAEIKAFGDDTPF